MSFTTVPIVSGSRTALGALAGLLNAAAGRQAGQDYLRAAVIGDSTASPAGDSVAYGDHLNILLGRYFHNSPATPLLPVTDGGYNRRTGAHSSRIDFGTPPALRIVNTLGSTNQCPPGFFNGITPYALTTKALMQGVNGYGGWGFKLDWRGLTPTSRNINAAKLMPETGLNIEVWACAANASGELVFEGGGTDTYQNIDYFFTAAAGDNKTTGAGGVASAGLNVAQTANHTTVKRISVGPFGNAAKQFPMVFIYTASGQADILGARWLNSSPVGIVVDVLGVGGATFASYTPATNQYANIGDIWNGLGYSIVFWELGINDVYGGTTAAAAAANAVADINYFNSMCSTPPLNILVAQPYRDQQGSDGTNYAAYKAQHDLLADQFAAVAAARTDTIALNVNRIMYEAGDNADGEGFYGCTDKGVYTVGANYAIGDLFSTPDGNYYRVVATYGNAQADHSPATNNTATSWCRQVKQYTADGVHPSRLGCLRRAEAVVNALMQARQQYVPLQTVIGGW